MTTTPPGHAGGGERLRSIDALRGIASLSVVLFHTLHKTNYIGADTTLGRVIAFPLRFGFAGVYLFFVISGFCIHLRWAKQASDDRVLDVPFIPFWRRRLRRLYPAYLASLCAYLLAGYLLDMRVLADAWGLDLVLHLLLAHNFLVSTCFSISGAYWTLAIEEQLYFMYFLLIWLRQRRSWTVILLVVGMARLGWFGVAFLVHRRLGIELPVSEAAASVWICWVLGAVAVEGWRGRIAVPRWMSSGWAGGLLLGVSIAVEHLGNVINQQGPVHHLIWLIRQPLWSFAFFIIVNVAVRAPMRGSGEIRGGVWATLGTFSYSLYLIHDLVVNFVCMSLARRFDWTMGTANAVALVIGVPVSIGAAWLFFLAFERPFLPRSSAQTATPLRDGTS